jgi:hypothetical protein
MLAAMTLALAHSAMKLTADEISIAAGVVALASAAFTGIGLKWARQSAAAAKTSADAATTSAAAAVGSLAVQTGQETENSPPRLSGAVKRQSAGIWNLVITLDSDRALTGMDVSVAENQGIWFPPGAPGVYPEPPEFTGLRSFKAFAFDLYTTHKPAGLQPQQAVKWGVMMANENQPPATLRVEANCRGEGGKNWPTVTVTAPVDPAKG